MPAVDVAVMVKVEAAELEPGVTDAAERAQDGFGAGPVTAQDN
jgi:hypothetical protein